MSSKGQIVIPRRIREHLRVSEGSLFAVVETDKAIILSKINKPSKEELLAELDRLTTESRKQVEKLGIKESDVPRLVDNYRKSKRLS